MTPKELPYETTKITQIIGEKCINCSPTSRGNIAHTILHVCVRVDNDLEKVGDKIKYSLHRRLLNPTEWSQVKLSQSR